ncbi:MAG: class I SAM-dependent methyltransferase, partial [Helicobacter sp.]|nr:class I SAM-dependent methyltransferase [Helicobacter sp.]
MECSICGCEMEIFYKSNIPFSVSSDNRILEESICLYSCKNCKHLSKFPKASLLNKLYNTYLTDAILPNNEQLKFDEGENKGTSAKVLENVLDFIPSKETLRILDIGSGCGGMLRAIYESFPKSETYAFDKTQEHLKEFLKIPNFVGFFEDIKDVNLGFDCITMVHTLEHIEDLSLLRDIWGALNDNGVFIVQIPNSYENLWDIFVYDHC